MLNFPISIPFLSLVVLPILLVLPIGNERAPHAGLKTQNTDSYFSYREGKKKGIKKNRKKACRSRKKLARRESPKLKHIETLRNKADSDGDLILDKFEKRKPFKTDRFTIDTDDDGLDDGAEVCDLNTDPLSSDSDGDGVLDGVDPNPLTPGDSDNNEDDGSSSGDEDADSSPTPIPSLTPFPSASPSPSPSPLPPLFVAGQTVWFSECEGCHAGGQAGFRNLDDAQLDNALATVADMMDFLEVDESEREALFFYLSNFP